MNEIGDWAYADEARYLRLRLTEWRRWTKMMDGDDLAELGSLEKLLAAYIEAHTVPDGGQRSMFQKNVAAGLGYAISIAIQRWQEEAD